MRWIYQTPNVIPDWIIGSNFARSKLTGVIIIHRLEVCHLIYPGDTVQFVGTGNLIITPGET